MRLFSRIVSAICNATFWLGVIALGSLLAIVTVMVFMRYVVGKTSIPGDEIGGYLLVGIVMLGGALALKRERHIAINVLESKLPSRWLSVGIPVLTMIGLGLFAWLSLGFVLQNKLDDRLSLFGFPVYIPQIFLFVGSTTWALQAIDILLHRFMQRKHESKMDV